MSTPTYYDDGPPMGISVNYPQNFANRPLSSEIYHPDLSSPFINPQASLENQYITSNEIPILAYDNIPPIDEKRPSATSNDDLIEGFTKIASFRFPSAPKSRIQALFAQAFETIEKESDSSTGQSSQSVYQLSSSANQDLYSTLLTSENSYSSSGYE